MQRRRNVNKQFSGEGLKVRQALIEAGLLIEAQSPKPAKKVKS
jgi:hypothetical protein